MWSKNLKSSPPPAEELTSRLLAASVLTQTGIPCVVWGEEALAWIHRVPTHIFYTLHLLVPESQLEKASQTLSSLLPEYAVTDPRSDYAGGWPLMPGEKEKFQEQGRFPHASPLSRRLVHTGLDSEKEAQQTQNARRQTHIPEYYPHTRFLLPLGRHGLYIDIQTRLFTRTHPTLSHRRSLSSASDHV